MPPTPSITDSAPWTVRRRWMPRLGSETWWGRFHRQFRKMTRRARQVGDVDPGCLDFFAEGVIAVIVIIVVVLVAVFVAFPLLVAVVDLVVLLLLAIVGVIARVVFRRPWIVEATSRHGHSLRWRVVGWRASRRSCDEIRDLLEAGIAPPDSEFVPRPVIEGDSA